MIGKTISHYRILSKLGEGGMGTVYVAEDTLLGRRVAVKSLTLPRIPGQSHFRTRFLREARAASALNHPHIATIHDYGETEDGQPYLVMELVSGQSLCEMLSREALPLERAIEIVEQVSEAIAEAHRHGIIHRDIKPSNVAINEREEVKVLDFGLAKQFETGDEAGEGAARTATETLEGVIIGTPSYLSPEQARGLPVDKRSDIFSLGSLLYECLTGKPAFTGAGLVEICAQVIRDDPPPPSQLNARVPPELDRLTLKALAKKTEERYQTVDELLYDLKAVKTRLAGGALEGRSRRPVFESTGARLRSSLARLSSGKRARIALGALAGLAIVAVLLTLWLSARRSGTPEPSPEAKRLYAAGIDALRDGSYFKASKLFEQAVQGNERFPLAHARLAEAWMELDYEGRATGEMLRVTELAPNLSSLPPIDILYLQAITATVRRNYQGAVESYEQIVGRLPEAEKASAYFDLGRAYERAGELNRAIGAFEEVTRRDSQSAAAFMRLGSLYGRRQEEAKAAAAFDQSLALYDAQGNFEGQAEVFYQRGAFLNLIDKLSEAHEQLRRALDLAVTTDNKPQQIKILLQLGGVSYSTGETLRAEQYATRAIELARSEQLDNLTTNGLVDIGNTFFLRGNYVEAEKYFEQARQIANANKGRRGEARALLSLGSLFVQQGSGGKALGYLEPALAFYRQANFRRETSQALLLLGYANEQQGNYEAAFESFSEQLKLAEQSGDTALAANAHAAIGLLLTHQERFAEALSHFAESYSINKSMGLEPRTGYDLVNRGNLLWQLGRYEEARDALNGAFDVASRTGGVDKQLLAWIHLFRARMAQSELRHKEALDESRRAYALGGTQDKDFSVQVAYTQGLAQAFSGTSRAGVAECQKAFDMATRAGDPRLISSAQLALAEAQALSGDAQGALTYALQAQEASARLGRRHSEWLAWLVAAEASRRLQDETKAHEYAAHASELLTALERAWGANDYRGYLSRPDVQRYRKQLDELLPGANN
ncbi:MAG TPA: tetratricopeptide repeat protein [Pyrinomonadaceae bacterium]|nr:tetratricopeptide repeat protein [Pyrinomonadaceae bacterium]